MKIKVLEGEVNYFKEATTIHVIAFGKIKENSKAIVKVAIEGVESSMLHSTCGCSTVASDEKDVYTIQYDNTHIVKPFAKVMVLNYEEGGVGKQEQIKITGTIIK